MSYPQLDPLETSQTDAEDKLEGVCPRSGEPDLYTNILLNAQATLKQVDFHLVVSTITMRILAHSLVESYGDHKSNIAGNAKEDNVLKT